MNPHGERIMLNTIRTIAVALALALVAGVASEAQATALSAARVTSSKNPGPIKRYLMKASTTIYAGGLVMINSSGTAEPAAASTTAAYVVGVATSTVTSASSGSYYVTAQEGWFQFVGTTLSQTDVGRFVYAEDDQTVDETPAVNEPLAGKIVEYVSASSAWVHVSPIYTRQGGGVATLGAAATLSLADCGRTFSVTAAIDGSSITLPEASTAANFGCTYKFIYTGADAGALIDITPLDSDADGIEGGCTLAASVVTFSGTADADVGLTKASILTGDTISVTAMTSAMWVAHDIQGICANN
jgi:hypothetical protein